MTTSTEVNPQVNQIEPIELLSQLADSKRSGCVRIDSGSVLWDVYLQQGLVKYINCSVESIEQLSQYLQILNLANAIAVVKKLPQSLLSQETDNTSLYQKVISKLIEEEKLDLKERVRLLAYIIQDNLNYCSFLPECSCVWQDNTLPPSWIEEKCQGFTGFSLSDITTKATIYLKQWQRFGAYVSSVHQRPYFTSGWERKSLPTNGSLDLKLLKELSSLIRGRTSIRQLSLLLKKEESKVIQILAPYIAAKIIYLREPADHLDLLPKIPQKKTKPVAKEIERTNNQIQKSKPTEHSSRVELKKIVCIDDSPTILQEIQRFLDGERFEVTTIDDPIKAASMVFRLKPDLILMDITMPKINGYKLCGLLRASAYCNQTPIVMVTGNTGLIDKARAKLSGANDYLTKPFTRESLNEVVDKYLP